MYHLYLLQPTDRFDYVVISAYDKERVEQDFGDKVIQVVDVPGEELMGFPCDRELRHDQ